MTSKALVAAAAALTMAGGAVAASRTDTPEARISFSSSIRDFRADGRNPIYIQDVHRI